MTNSLVQLPHDFLKLKGELVFTSGQILPLRDVQWIGHKRPAILEQGKESQHEEKGWAHFLESS